MALAITICGPLVLSRSANVKGFVSRLRGPYNISSMGDGAAAKKASKFTRAVETGHGDEPEAHARRCSVLFLV